MKISCLSLNKMIMIIFKVRDAIQDFIRQLFTRNRAFAKSDLEMFTDVYKVLERSLVN